MTTTMHLWPVWFWSAQFGGGSQRAYEVRRCLLRDHSNTLQVQLDSKCTRRLRGGAELTMKLHEWLLLLLAYVLFLLVGAASFYFLEREQEKDQVQRVLQLRKDIQEELIEGENRSTMTRRAELLDRISGECRVDITNTSRPPATVWTEYNSFFFCFTVVTTIGYGHIAPSTMLGRIACIFYALIGIPLNGILLKNISDLFSNKVIRAHQRIKERRYQTKLEVFVDTLFYLSPAVLLFFLVPAGIFIMLEEWNFFQAIYYTFITLTTIGFGDLVAGKVNDAEDASAWIWIYKIGLVVWIIFGLGYLLMILDFISRALYSKKILLRSRRLMTLEKKVIRGITKTKEKFQRNISKEVLQIKNILNELAFNRREVAKPPAAVRSLVRTQSFPNLVSVGGGGGGGGGGDDAAQLLSVDSALEVLLQATVTLEWDTDSTDSRARR
ncbi:open rectifier potassium channel protein 1-like [Pollicipes pollicipes]|uniref:open rectifier potassium channel protein 1-like n=1 Tax=Pollicipes pollicipes TaxID=41117 RepID=UPI00188509EC|nr:open rectifier potassium channel protein 1-like [Pollicipes pollicipes]